MTEEKLVILDVARITACGYLNRATRRHTRFCGNKSRRASAERAVLIASSQRKERVESLSRQARLKSWIEPFRGVMQKPPSSAAHLIRQRQGSQRTLFGRPESKAERSPRKSVPTPRWRFLQRR